MSAPPQPPPSAVNGCYDDDDGFDWEAAVLEIDKVCAQKAVSASASAPAPEPAPVYLPPERSSTAPVRKPQAVAGGGARQSTLDRFVNFSTGARREKERPAPAPSGGGGHPAVGAGEGCSRQAAKNGLEDRFMESFSLRREEKAALPVAAAPAPAGGRGRPGVRASKGCALPVVEEVSYEPCAVALDQEAVQTWIYPTNIELREYQKSMVEKALFTNTLIALPTGLGKTFIAAVVMYNYFRWFPEGKIVFTAPSRPLVTQQIEACHNTVGIPQEWTIDMKGNRSPSSRSHFWMSKRVFFVTPQVLANDIQSGICSVKKIVCLVIDEAHRASGNYAYCTAVRELVAAHVPLRILALTATPGSKHADIQNVINNLCISDLVYCDEEDSEVSRYINVRKVELVKVPFDSDETEVDNLLLDIMRPRLSRLRDAGVIDHRDISNWTPFGLLNYKDKFVQAPPPNFSEEERAQIRKYFTALGSLCHIRKLLLSHGVKQAYQFLENKSKKGSLILMRKDELFCKLKDKMKHVSSKGSAQKIQELIRVVEGHFKNTDSKKSRVIIFSHFRGSVKEIYLSLQSIDDRLIRPVEFIGQSTTGKQSKGQSQKLQQVILQKFRSGKYNVLVATSIGEEGLDIIEVDLVICFDANVSPLRMIQRMGRTGRKNEGRVVVLACDGQEAKGYSKKQGDARTMRKLLRNSERFEYHASPRMVPHVFKPEIKCLKLTIEKYIPCSKKTKNTTNGPSPIQRKMSEEDGRLFARYFGACREDMWRPSLVAFPRFQLSPSIVHKVPHSFRTTDMLIDAMQQLQDVSFRTKSEKPFQELADVTAVKDQAHEGLGLNAVNETKGAMPQECNDLEASSRETVSSQNVCEPCSPAMTHSIHSFFSGDSVTVDRRGNVSVSFVPVLPQIYACRKDTKNASWCFSVEKMVVDYKSATNFSKATVECDHVAYVTDPGKHMLKNSVSSLSPHYRECDEQGDNAGNCMLTTPSKVLTSPRDKWNTPCNASLVSSTFSSPNDTEVSPRSTHYTEEEIVPESPVLDVSYLQELGGAVDAELVPSSKPLGVVMQANSAGYNKEPLLNEKTDGCLSGITKFDASSRHKVLDQNRALAEKPPCLPNGKLWTPSTHIKLSPRLTHYMEEEIVPESPVIDVRYLQELGGAVDAGLVPSSKPLGVVMQANAAGYKKESLLHEKTDGCLCGIAKFDVSSRHNVHDQNGALAEKPACPSNGKLCTPSHTSTNLLCDSLSNDFQLKPGGDNTSGSVQQEPKYRRLCKYGDKIKKVPISFDGCHEGFGDIAAKNIPNQMEHTIGNKRKAKRRLDTYIDEEVEVSQDADVSEDEDDNQSEDKYEDSFIDDQETPTGKFTQTEQRNGKNCDMMAFYRQSLLTQTPLVLPSRYLDASDSSVSSRTRNVSSSETGHNSVEIAETPKGPPLIHHIMDPSSSLYRQRLMEGTSVIKQQSEPTIGNCESSSKMECRKRKLSFQEPASIPVINLEPEPACRPSSHLAAGTNDDLYLDDAFFEGLDLDAIEAQATEHWKQKTAQLMQKPVELEPKKASEVSFAPPSFDLGF